MAIHTVGNATGLSEKHTRFCSSYDTINHSYQNFISQLWLHIFNSRNLFSTKMNYNIQFHFTCWFATTSKLWSMFALFMRNILELKKNEVLLFLKKVYSLFLVSITEKN